jgi:hypothetical protein
MRIAVITALALVYPFATYQALAQRIVSQPVV